MRVVETYNTFITKVEELDLPGTVEAKPILDVRQIQMNMCSRLTLLDRVVKLSKFLGFPSLEHGWAR